MITVIGVRFRKAGKMYYFDPAGVWPRPGEFVVVETSRGLELGEVTTGARELSDDQIVQPLKKVIRAALPEDIERARINEQREKEALPICQARIEAHKLDMKLVDVEYTFDNSKVIFYFTSDGRVDFRELVKDLASIFKMRIELRQIGVRDEAKLLGGLGACGRQICCAAFLGDFQPLTIKMAKEQNLSLNPVKISGQCGRLMCCLRYEQPYYEEMLHKVPRVGAEIVTPDGVGTVSEVFVIRGKVRVRIRTDGDEYEMREYDIDDVGRNRKKPQHAAAQETAEQDAGTQSEPVQENAAPSESEAPAEPEKPAKKPRLSPRGRVGRKTVKEEPEKPEGEASSAEHAQTSSAPVAEEAERMEEERVQKPQERHTQRRRFRPKKQNVKS